MTWPGHVDQPYDRADRPQALVVPCLLATLDRMPSRGPAEHFPKSLNLKLWLEGPTLLLVTYRYASIYAPHK